MGRFGFLVCFFLAAAANAGAHAITALSVVSDFRASGEYRLELGIDVALVRDAEDEAGVPVDNPNAPLSAEEIVEVEAQVREYIETSLRFHLDEETFEPAFSIEEAGGDGELEGAEPPGGAAEGEAPRKRYAAKAEGVIPGKPAEFLLEATPEAVAPVVFIIFRDGKPTRHSQVLYSGEFSRPVDLEAIRSGEPLQGRKPNAPPVGVAVADAAEPKTGEGEKAVKTEPPPAVAVAVPDQREKGRAFWAGTGAVLAVLLAMVLIRWMRRGG